MTENKLELYEHQHLISLDLGTSEPLIEGLMLAHDKVMCVARYKAGKSVWSQQLAQCVAGAHSFLGYRVPVARPVLYIAGEGDLDEFQQRSRAMEPVLPVPKDMMYWWPFPEYPLNTDKGKELLMKAAKEAQPGLMIFDPAYILMKGSLSDDEAVSEFIHNIGYVQGKMGCAVVIMHHTHRNIRTNTGQVVIEGDEAFHGSMLWKAWPTTVFLLTVRADKARVLSCDTARRRVMLEKPVPLTMVEPYPLLYQWWQEGMTPTMAFVLNNLKLRDMTEAELIQASAYGGTIPNSHSSTWEATHRLEEEGLVKSEGRPAVYSVKEVS